MTKIDICNMALALVKQAGINSVDEKTERARLCKLFYDESRRNVLSQHDWAFARVIIPLSVLNVPDEYKLEGYDYYYQYPADILTLRGLHSSGSYDTNLEIKEVYIKEIDQRVILGTQEGLVAEGTLDMEDTRKFPLPFVRALAYDLAAQIAQSLTGNEQLANSLMQKSMLQLQNAENHNSAEYWGEADLESSTLNARS